MKKLLLPAIFSMAFFASLVSCEGVEPNYKEVYTPGVDTGECENITETTAIVHGLYHLYGHENLEFGIRYSESEAGLSNGDYIALPWATKDSDDVFTCILTGLSPNTEYFYCAYMLPDGESLPYEIHGGIRSFKTLLLPQPVDLGLDVMWASFNLGAVSPEEFGAYHQWAGTEDVTSTNIYIDWANCPYHTGPYETLNWTKYIPLAKLSYWSGSGSPDNLKVLDLDDDAVHVKFGGTWRIPTDAEWTDLREKCKWSWENNYKGTGVAGYVVSSLAAGKTDNSIFLPAAGSRYRGILDSGQFGGYLSSSLCEDNPDEAWYVEFDSYGIERRSYGRCSGHSLRPVCEK